MKDKLHKDRLSNLPFKLPTVDNGPTVEDLNAVLSDAKDMLAQMQFPAEDTTVDRKARVVELQQYINARVGALFADDDKFVYGEAESLSNGDVIIPDNYQPLRQNEAFVFDLDKARVSYGRPLSDGWDQKRINEWQDKIFGLKNADPAAIMEKLKEEVDELYVEMNVHSLVVEGDQRTQLAERVRVEIADVVIMAYHLAGHLGFSIQEYIDQKMDINENQRTWKTDGRGSGHHDREE